MSPNDSASALPAAATRPVPPVRANLDGPPRSVGILDHASTAPVPCSGSGASPLQKEKVRQSKDAREVPPAKVSTAEVPTERRPSQKMSFPLAHPDINTLLPGCMEPTTKDFPHALYDVLESEEYAQIASWLPHGKSFSIIDKDEFAAIILPKHFGCRHGKVGAKWTSFTRRLKRWQFHRVPAGKEMGAYYHEMFMKGKPKLVDGISYPGKTTKGGQVKKVCEAAAPGTKRPTNYAPRNGNGAPPEKKMKTQATSEDDAGTEHLVKKESHVDIVEGEGSRTRENQTKKVPKFVILSHDDKDRVKSLIQRQIKLMLQNNEGLPPGNEAKDAVQAMEGQYHKPSPVFSLGAETPKADDTHDYPVLLQHQSNEKNQAAAPVVHTMEGSKPFAAPSIEVKAATLLENRKEFPAPTHAIVSRVPSEAEQALEQSADGVRHLGYEKAAMQLGDFQEEQVLPHSISPRGSHVNRSFPHILHDVLQNSQYSKIISWRPRGKSFYVFDKKKLMDIVLPKHFGLNLISFKQCLAQWGFIRIRHGPDMGAFVHKAFVRDRPELLKEFDVGEMTLTTRNKGLPENGPPAHQERVSPLPVLEDILTLGGDAASAETERRAKNQSTRQDEDSKTLLQLDQDQKGVCTQNPVADTVQITPCRKPFAAGISGLEAQVVACLADGLDASCAGKLKLEHVQTEKPAQNAFENAPCHDPENPIPKVENPRELLHFDHTITTTQKVERTPEVLAEQTSSRPTAQYIGTLGRERRKPIGEIESMAQYVRELEGRLSIHGNNGPTTGPPSQRELELLARTSSQPQEQDLRQIHPQSHVIWNGLKRQGSMTGEFTFSVALHQERRNAASSRVVMMSREEEDEFHEYLRLKREGLQFSQLSRR